MHLTIEITEEQHRYIENSAKIEGKSLRDFVLEKAMSDSFEILEEDEDIRDLLEFLKLRIESAKRENMAKVNIDGIIAETIERNQGDKIPDLESLHMQQPHLLESFPSEFAGKVEFPD